MRFIWWFYVRAAAPFDDIEKSRATLRRPNGIGGSHRGRRSTRREKQGPWTITGNFASVLACVRR